MYKSQFRKIDPYDWFCGSGSHISHSEMDFKALEFQEVHLSKKKILQTFLKTVEAK